MKWSSTGRKEERKRGETRGRERMKEIRRKKGRMRREKRLEYGGRGIRGGGESLWIRG